MMKRYENHTNKGGRRLLSLAVLLFVSSAAAAVASDRPNILFFLVDDMGVADNSVQFLYDTEGKPVRTPLTERYNTPNMERLALQGRKFTQARAYSMCSPTRTSLMSGLDPARMHITGWTAPNEPSDTVRVRNAELESPEWNIEGLDVKLPTLPRLLGQAGYRTIHCGKAHFGPDSTRAGNPENLGFDVNIAGYGGGGPGSYWGEKNYSAAWRGGSRVWDVPGLSQYHGTDTFLTEALTLEIGEELERTVKSGKPFFAYMSHYAVHVPFEADARFTGNYPELKGGPRAFATLVEGMDKSLGDLLDRLDKLGVAEKTIVVFFSDNGSDGPTNLPLRGGKATPWEGGCRVPMIVSWAKPDPSEPLQKLFPIPANTTDDRMVFPQDFLPTLCTLAGAKKPELLDGRDISPYFTGADGKIGRDNFLVHFPHRDYRSSLYTTWRDGDLKVSYDYNNRSWSFVNTREDVSEKQNALKQNPAEALRLAKEMIAYVDRIGGQWPMDPKTEKPIKPDLSGIETLVQENPRACPATRGITPNKS